MIISARSLDVLKDASCALIFSMMISLSSDHSMAKKCNSGWEANLAASLKMSLFDLAIPSTITNLCMLPKILVTRN